MLSKIKNIVEDKRYKLIGIKKDELKDNISDIITVKMLIEKLGGKLRTEKIDTEAELNYLGEEVNIKNIEEKLLTGKYIENIENLTQEEKTKKITMLKLEYNYYVKEYEKTKKNLKKLETLDKSFVNVLSRVSEIEQKGKNIFTLREYLEQTQNADFKKLDSIINSIENIFIFKFNIDTEFPRTKYEFEKLIPLLELLENEISNLEQKHIADGIDLTTGSGYKTIKTEEEINLNLNTYINNAVEPEIIEYTKLAPYEHDISQDKNIIEFRKKYLGMIEKYKSILKKPMDDKILPKKTNLNNKVEKVEGVNGRIII